MIYAAFSSGVFLIIVSNPIIRGVRYWYLTSTYINIMIAKTNIYSWIASFIYKGSLSKNFSLSLKHPVIKTTIPDYRFCYENLKIER